MNNYNYYMNWIDLDHTIEIKKSKTILTKYISTKSYNDIYISNNIDNDRSFSIAFEPMVLSKYKPIIVKGVKIDVRKNDKIDSNKLFLVFSSENNELDEAFLAFSVSIINSIENCKNDIETIEEIEKTLKEFYDFFSFRKEMSKMEEQGLLCELDYLLNLIDTQGENSIVNWLGPEKNKRDFLFETKAVEIKSSRMQKQTIAHISNENQLDKGNLEQLDLILYIVDVNDLGKTVSEYINLINSKLKDVQMKKLFISKLRMLKIDPSTFESHYHFVIEQIRKYKVDDNFPKITKNNISSEAFDVDYWLNLSNVSFENLEVYNG